MSVASVINVCSKSGQVHLNMRNNQNENHVVVVDKVVKSSNGAELIGRILVGEKFHDEIIALSEAELTEYNNAISVFGKKYYDIHSRFSAIA